MQKRSAAQLQHQHRMKLSLTEWRVIKPAGLEDFSFSASLPRGMPALWNA